MASSVSTQSGGVRPVIDTSTDDHQGNLLSLVVPAYNEEENIERLYARLTNVLEATGVAYEVVFMDNGSSDRTGPLARELAKRDQRWRYVRLSRNFGYHINVTAGLSYARGDAIVIIDSDLQDPPELIPAFLDKYREGYDVVYGIRAERRGEPWWRRTAMRVYYRLLNRLSTVPLPLDAGDFRLISRRVQKALLRFPETSRYLVGMFAYIGYRQTGVPYTRNPRAAGESKFPFWRMVSLGLDGIISFSMLPLRAMALVGSMIVLAGVGYGAFAVYERLFNQVPAGWTTVVVLVLVLGGLQLLFLGLIGEYVGRIYMDVKQRPLWLVAEEVNVESRSRAAQETRA